MVMILMKMILKLLSMSDFRLGIINLKNVKYVKRDISKELMSVVWYPTRGIDACQKVRKKKWNQFLLIELVDNKVWWERVKMLLMYIGNM